MVPGVRSAHQSRGVFLLISIILVALIVPSCAPEVPGPRYVPAPKRTAAAPLPLRPALPEGWADITTRSKLPQIKRWLVNRDYSGTMVLREFQGDPSVLRQLQTEEVTMAAAMSLRSKIPENHPDFRVTRVPAVIDLKRNLVSYAYTERGLLRRVVVFRKLGTFMELELMQEQPAAEFDTMTNDLVMFAVQLYDR
jgi:hypothetical protein